ncbi:metal-dependent hydrolase [Gracilibacillus caseinilyticus]|uniref:Metal-dependent hydrolase n=1 Tax=Gracilibacillus caseinilyticus TaxID=2932256 RepID=A0ABY4EYG1_9BACI|nr:metal-dependent hydrolase [Gracilibacillus caseinilyticus]UOQ49303.1 metal-dependent hydrolase [Gracilibacillus caseinilyticus]
MTGKTHLMGGIATATVLATYTEYDPGLFIAAGAIGGLIPDICHGGSKIGRRFPLLSKIINSIFGHRTFTHSLLFLVVMHFILTMFITNQSIIMGGMAGMVSHFVLDAMTKNGIKLFYPVNITVRFPVTTRTGGTVEHVVLLVLTIVTIYYGKDIISTPLF